MITNHVRCSECRNVLSTREDGQQTGRHALWCSQLVLRPEIDSTASGLAEMHRVAREQVAAAVLSEEIVRYLSPFIDCGVFYVQDVREHWWQIWRTGIKKGQPLVRVYVQPGQGQYVFNPSNGTYIFSEHDAGAELIISTRKGRVNGVS